jgi:protein-tyrosine kinase
MNPRENAAMSEQDPQDSTIGDIVRKTYKLSGEQVERIVEHQNKNSLRFGESAVALGILKKEDVLWALSQQFHYPYSNESENTLNPELVLATNPFSPEAELFRGLRSKLLSTVFAPVGPRRAMAVVSPQTGDGKTFFAANLAVAFSQLGGRTLLIDADMRTPRQHKLFGLEAPDTGLSGVLSGRAESNVIRPLAELPNLYLMPVGVQPPNPQELVQRPAFGMLIRELCQKFDQVIVDTPSASFGADARVIAAATGSAMLVTRKNSTNAVDAKRFLDDLRALNVQVVGAVVNAV